MGKYIIEVSDHDDNRMSEYADYTNDEGWALINTFGEDDGVIVYDIKPFKENDE